MEESTIKDTIEKQNTEKEERSALDSVFYKYINSVDRGKFGLKEKILLFKELSYLLKWWVSLVECMNIIRTWTNNTALKNVSKRIMDYIYRWKSLSYAFNRLPQYFNAWDYYILKAWEMSGSMPNVLQSLSSEYQFLNDIKNKYVSALVYPVLLVVVAIVAVLALFLLVLPNVFTLADSFQNISLPWTTQFLRDISTFMQTQWKMILVVIVLLSVFFSVFFSMDTWKKNWFQILFRFPLIGKMTKYFYLVKWCRYMKLMVSSGMNYVQTFQLLKEILWIPAYTSMIDWVLSWLQRWEMIHSSLKDHKAIIPNDVMVLIKVWEETANLNNSLDNVLVLYEWELMDMINRLAKVIEPIMLVFIWGIVTIIALWVFGLIMQIMEWAWI